MYQFVIQNPQVRPPALIGLLGPFRLTLGGHAAPIGNGSKSEALLTCLALPSEHRVSRLRLLEVVWANCDTSLAGQSLNSLTYRLNKLASDSLNGGGLIAHQDGYYYLNRQGGVSVDIDDFDALRKLGKSKLKNGDNATGLRHCKQALALYRGDLSADLSLRALIERERLRADFLDLLGCLANYHYSRQEINQALTYCHRLLTHDPCREDAHCMIMRCYVQLGQRTQALRQYRLCCQILKREFEVTPEPATVTLYEQIRLKPETIT